MKSLAWQPASPLPAPARPAPVSAIRLAQIVTLAGTLLIPGLLCLGILPIGDPDCWWHLRTAEWIVSHRALPHHDPFSSFAQGRSWVPYSWLFDLLLLGFYKLFGLRGLLAYTTGMVLAIGMALHRLIRRRQRDFSLGLGLTLLAMVAMAHLDAPRPWLCTILLFTVELDLLLEARATGNPRPLLWLPLLFALWANLHIQFVDGLVLLTIALIEALYGHIRPHTPVAPPALKLRWSAGILLASLAATLLNPQGVALYQAAHELASQAAPLAMISEMQAMPFRELPDFLVLLLILAAVAALARSRQPKLFETLALAFAILLTVRSQRDVWLGSLIAAAILAAELRGGEQSKDLLPTWGRPLAAALALTALLAVSQIMGHTEATLRDKAATSLPIHAAEFVQTHSYPGPLYTEYTWGGYLLWSLYLPPNIDGRAALMGDDHLHHSKTVIQGQPGWTADPELSAAQLAILPVTAPLTQLLRLDARFHLVYEDAVAAAFVRR